VLCAIIVIGAPQVAYASDIIGSIGTQVSNIATSLRNIAVGVGTLFIIIALIIMMISKNQRAVDEARAWVFRIVIAVVLIFAAERILAWAQSLGESA